MTGAVEPVCDACGQPEPDDDSDEFVLCEEDGRQYLYHEGCYQP